MSESEVVQNEMVLDLAEARRLVHAGVEYALALGRFCEDAEIEIPDDSFVTPYREAFLGSILDNHVPWTEWGAGPTVREPHTSGGGASGE